MRKFFEHPLTVAVFSAIILKAAEVITQAIGGVEVLKPLMNHFIIELWPIWAGLIIGGIYWMARFFLRLHKAMALVPPNLISQLAELAHHVGELQKFLFESMDKEAKNRIAAIDGLSKRINQVETRLPPSTGIVPPR